MMRKKRIALFVAAVMLLGSMMAFAASAPTDIKGNPYEAAINSLVEKGIISGYEDGTFRPDNTLTRAEACILVTKANKIKESTAKSGFKDVDGTWTQPYVAAAAEKKIVSGYGDGTFKPQAKVSVQELVTMILSAKGEQPTTGTWPSNYIEKAVASGLTKNTSISDWTAPAARGLTAQLVYNALPTDTTTGGGVTTPGGVTPPQTTKPAIDPDAISFGMITGTPRVMDSEGSATNGLSFVFGKTQQDLVINGDKVSAVPKEEDYLAGQLYEVWVRKGEVTSIYAPGFGTQRSSMFEERTTDAGVFVPVTGVDDKRIQVEGTYYPLSDRTVVYVATFDKDENLVGYEFGSTSSITKGSMVRGYDVTDDKDSSINVVVVVKRTDVDKL